MTNQYANDFTRTVTDYYNDLKKYKPITKTREKRLLKLSKRGNLKAKNEILESNLKFVFDIAKHYTGRGVPISDLISEGNMGLLRAIEKFDEERDIKFISYAVWWIRQAMLESIKKKKLLNIIEIENSDSTSSVLENTISDSEDEVVTQRDRSFSNEDEEVAKETNKNQKDVISRMLKKLSSRERDIIENYYGLGKNKELTLFEIGEKYKLSSERVRQIKKNGLRKLRSQMMMYDGMEDLFS